MSQTGPQNNSAAHGWIFDWLACLQFFTRLPVKLPGSAAPDYTIAWRAAPLAGAVVGAIGGLVLIILLWLGMASELSAGFALTAMVVATGALHEDALADVADGFGGGATRERKLEIMRDSRIGTYGTASVALSLLLRWGTIVAIATAHGTFALAVLISAGAVSRWLAVALPTHLPPARTDGLAVSTGMVTPSALRQCAIVAIVIALILSGLVAGFVWTVLAIFLAWLTMWLICRLARNQIGGYTGDVIGAAQQATEIVFLAVLTFSLST